MGGVLPVSWQSIKKSLWVSGPYRGMGGVLLKHKVEPIDVFKFPAPIEVWVVSYVEDPKGVTVHV